MAGHVFHRNIQFTGDCALHGLRILGGRPPVTLPPRKSATATGGFHRRVREQRHVVVGFDNLAVLRKLRLDVTRIADDLAGCATLPSTRYVYFGE